MGHWTRSSARNFRRFSSLPTELRCKVWRLATTEHLDGASQISLNNHLFTDLSNAGVLTASREAQYEVESLFYKHIVFTYDVTSAGINPLMQKLRRLARRNRRQIKHIIFHLSLGLVPLSPEIRDATLDVFEDIDLRARVEVVLNCSSVGEAQRMLRLGEPLTRWYRRHYGQEHDKVLHWYVYHVLQLGDLKRPGWAPQGFGEINRTMDGQYLQMIWAGRSATETLSFLNFSRNFTAFPGHQWLVSRGESD